MVDGVNFNPFTNQVLTPEQIEKLDTDKNGVVSLEEMEAGLSWLKETDEDGEVQLNSTLFDNVKNAGGTDKAKTQKEFREAMEIVADEFLEIYLSENSGLDAAQIQRVKDLIKKTTTTFCNELIKADTNGPWDIKLASIEFENDMRAAIKQDQENLNIQKAAVDGYKNSTEENLTALKNYTISAMENGNISNTEWEQIKNKSVQYLMGLLLGDGNEEEANEFLSSINKNYKSNSNYKTALNAINKIKTSQDPAEIQKAIQDATAAIKKFIESSGKDKVASGIQSFAATKAQEQATKDLSGIKDSLVESNITADMTDQEKLDLKATFQGWLDNFVKECYSTGEYVPMEKYKNISDPKAAFSKYMNDQISGLKSNKETIKNTYTDKTENLYNNLIYVTDVANDGYISEVSTDSIKSDKDKIIDAATEFLIAQLLNEEQNIELLANLGVSQTDLAEAKTILSELKSCSDPEKLTELINKAKDSIKAVLSKFSGNDLVKAVNRMKPIEISNSTKDKAILNSEIYQDYEAGVSRSGGRGKTDNQELRKEIEDMARQDMEKYAEALKAQLKLQLGSDYNEDDINQIVQSAINDTITQFWSGYHDRGNQHGDYSTPEGTNSFTSARRSNTKKRRFSYNVKDLINTFTTNFNKAAKELKEQQRNTAAITYDKEDVLVNAGYADEYGIGEGESKAFITFNDKIDQSTNKQTVELKNKAKAILQGISAQMKSSMLAKGCTIPEAAIDKILDDAYTETMLDIDALFNRQSNRFMGFNEVSLVVVNMSYKDLIDNFMTKVDTKLEEYRSKNK